VNSWGIGKGGAFPADDISLNYLADHGGISIMGNIGNDGNIGFNATGNHFGTAQPNLFLYGIHHLQSIG
jgi:hypothetical protein